MQQDLGVRGPPESTAGGAGGGTPALKQLTGAGLTQPIGFRVKVFQPARS
jgi:hypothetical protein